MTVGHVYVYVYVYAYVYVRLIQTLEVLTWKNVFDLKLGRVGLISQINQLAC